MRARNERLARAVREAGYSYAELARQIRSVAAENGLTARTNSSAIAHWVAGTRPNRRTAELVAEALSRGTGRALSPQQLDLADASGEEGEEAVPAPGLGADRDPLDVLDLLAGADLERRDLSRAIPYSVPAAALPLDASAPWSRTLPVDRPGVMGEQEVEAVREMTRLFTAVDERHGGQHGRSALVQYLRSDVADLCRARFRTQELKARMLSAGACVVYLAGWKAYDAGEQGLAQRYYLQAYRLTREAGNDLHSAFVLRVLAHHGMEVGRPEHSLDLIDAALRHIGRRSDPATEALYVVTRARALAMADRGREAVAEAARAERLVQDADEREMPYWAALWGSARACVGNHSAKAAEHMGSYAVAEQHFSRAVRRRPGGQYRRITALNVAHTGAMQCRQGRVEQACDTWRAALELMDGVRSARVLRAVADMRHGLSPYCHGRVPAALDLAERIRLWSAQEGR